MIVGLAPMDGVTDVAMRQIQAKIAPPDLMFTEFVSAEGLAHGATKLFTTLLYTPIQRPIIGQLFGKDPQSFYLAAQILARLGFSGIDINMGCPARRVTQHGSGAALIDQPQLARQIIQAVQAGVGDYTPQTNFRPKIQKAINANLKICKHNPKNYQKPTISVKTRLGINRNIVSSWTTFLLQQHLDFITIHGRTLKQGYSGQADWSSIQKIYQQNQTKTKIFGNGDITSLKQAKKYQVDGVLVGRAACGNPWLFADITPTPVDRFRAMLLHAKLYQRFFPGRRFEPMRKHLLFYTKNLPNAKKLRQILVTASSANDLQKVKLILK